MLVGHDTCRRRRVGIEDERPVSHRGSGHQRVPAQLTAAEHPDRGGRKNDRTVHGGGSTEPAAASRRAARYASRRAARSASSAARSATANSAALVAPASPIANVATGTP